MSENGDSKKYFKIQVDSREVNGTVISVDSSRPLQISLEDLTSAYKIEYVKGENPHYLFFEKSYQVPRDTIASSPQASLADTVTSVKIGKDSKEPLLKAIINEEGNLKVTENKRNIFITEIDQYEAKEMIESARNWRMLQSWV